MSARPKPEKSSEPGFVAARDALATELAFAASVTATERDAPLTSLRIETSGGILAITGTDGAIFVRTSVGGVEGSASLLAHGRRLASIVRALAPGNVSVAAEADGAVRIASGGAGFRVYGPGSITIAEAPEPAEGGIEIDSRLLAEALGATCYATHNGEGRRTLGAVRLAVSDGRLVAIATDGNRIARFEAGGMPLADPFVALIERKAVSIITGMLKDASGSVFVSGDRGWVHVVAGTRRVSVRRLEGVFPECESVIPRGEAQSLTVDREALLGAVRRVALFAEKSAPAIDFECTDGVLRLGASNAETGEAEDSVDATGAGVRTTLNARYLAECLDHLRGAAIRISFDGGHSPFSFEDAGTGTTSTLGVVMPMVG